MAAWIRLCQQQPDASTIQRLEEIAAAAPDAPIALVCRAVALWLREPDPSSPNNGDQEPLAMLQQAISSRQALFWDACFWQGMIYASQGLSEAVEQWELALQSGMPPILLMPLHWLEQDQPAFYEKYAAPLLARYELSPLSPNHSNSGGFI